MSAIAERVREAHWAQQRLRIVGAGTWTEAGRPVEADETLSVADHRGIIEYVPGDLTLTARAGTPLSEITAVTGAEGQWLPLDPWGGDDGTLGATLSTATAGPHAFAMGLPRDVVLGVEFVAGSGQVVRAGGRVVKNVAGFDLTRMVIGSWGTLGVITEATVRLRSRPEHTSTIAISVATSHGSLNELATRLRALPFAPLASELINGRLAAQLGLGDDALLVARVGGNEKAVRAQLDLLRSLGDARDTDETVWHSLRAPEPEGSASWRWSQLPSVFGETWAAADRATRTLGGARMHGNPARGVVRIVASDTQKVNAAELTRAAAAFSGTVAIECLPPNAWSLVAATPAQDPVSRGIRAKFDPGRVLNAGIMGRDS